MVLTRAFACATPVLASDIDGLPRGRHARDRAHRATGRRAGARRRASSASSPTKSVAPRWARRHARTPSATTPGRTSPRGSRTIYERVGLEPGGTRGVKLLDTLYRNPWARGIAVLATLVAALLVLWWRGPEWDTVYDAFRFVSWRWVLLAVLLNLVSVIVRAWAWNVTIHQAMPPPAAALRRGVLGLRRRPAGERRAPGAGGRARTGRRPAAAPSRGERLGRDPARHRLRPPGVRRVPDRAARRLRAPHREAAALGGHRRRRRRAGRPRAADPRGALGAAYPGRAGALAGAADGAQAARDGPSGARGAARPLGGPRRRSCSRSSAGRCSSSPSGLLPRRSASTSRSRPPRSSCC